MRMCTRPSDAQVASAGSGHTLPPSLPPAQSVVGAASKVTNHHSVEDICALLQTVQLGHCVPIIAKNRVNGRELLKCTQSEFIHMLTIGGMLPFKARAAWDQLQPCLEPAVGHVGVQPFTHSHTHPFVHSQMHTDSCNSHLFIMALIFTCFKKTLDLIRTRHTHAHTCE